LFFPARREGFLTEPKNTLTLKFNTPVLLKERGKWVEPDFGALIKRLRDRLCALSYFYCGKTVELDYSKVGDVGQSVEVVDAGLHWVEESRYARHRNLWHFLKGYIGSITYKGDMEPFMPMLHLGEFVHVGKSTAFGQGWYTIKE
jgi:CRISPR-associated endoribonuclease Cas6